MHSNFSSFSVGGVDKLVLSFMSVVLIGTAYGLGRFLVTLYNKYYKD